MYHNCLIMITEVTLEDFDQTVFTVILLSARLPTLCFIKVNSLCNTMLEELLFGGSHKYVAHQFALLYRALTATGLVLQSYRIKVKDFKPSKLPCS